jgi:hypothetical protein
MNEIVWSGKAVIVTERPFLKRQKGVVGRAAQRALQRRRRWARARATHGAQAPCGMRRGGPGERRLAQALLRMGVWYGKKEEGA